MATSKKTDDQSKGRSKEGKGRAGAEQPEGGSKGRERTASPGGKPGRASEERGGGKKTPRS